MTAYKGKAIVNMPIDTKEETLNALEAFLASVERDGVYISINNNYHSMSWDVCKTDIIEIRRIFQSVIFAESADRDWSKAYQELSEYEASQHGRQTPANTELLISKIELLWNQAQKPIDDETKFIKTLSKSEKEVYEAVKEQALMGLECAVSTLAYLKEIRTGKVSINDVKY